MKKILLVLGFLFAAAGAAQATPSTQIWIPSSDIQGYMKWHLGFDEYLKARNPNGEANVINNGITVGVLPYDKVQMEVGIDERAYGVKALDQSPIYMNVKIGTPEDSLFKGSPAIAIGGYDFGTKKFDSTSGLGTDYNITYGVVAKTFGALGRVSFGYYTGSDKLLLDKNGNKDNSGVLASWDKTVSEISDKLWVAIDYMGGENSYGALSYGVAWKFAPNVSVILGQDKYNNSNYRPTYTLQVDIDY